MTPITAYLWSDPNNDGNPLDAVVLQSVAGVSALEGTNTFINFSIAPTMFAAGDFFFAGFQGLDFMGGLDQDSSAGQSWAFSNSSAALLDPNALGATLIGGVVDGFGFPGNWLIRADGVTVPALAVTPIRRRKTTPTFLVTDVGAIYSTMTSGLGMGLVNQQVTQSAPNAALSDLNNRLFRARSGRENAPSALVSTIGGDSSLLRYLAFNQDENMSYKVALGLADAGERIIEVGGVADTLAANGLSGGLPYAMMGVPMMPMAGGAATVHIVEAAPSGKTVIDDAKAVVEGTELKRWEMFVAGDFSNYDQDQLSNLMQGFTTTTYAGTAGIEYRVTDWLNLGAAWSYLQSDTNVAGNYGDIDLEGNLISGYATTFWRQYWADLLYSYGSFNNDISRNTGLGSRANGDADSQSHNIRLNFGRNFNVTRNIVTGPIAGLRYGTGDVDSYSERGGGSAALNYNGTDFESMVSRLGWQATHTQATGWGRLVSQVRLAWEHEYMPQNGVVGASLQTSPFALVTGNNVSRLGGFSAEDGGAYPGTDWLTAGAGLRFELANGVAFLTDYEGVFFRNNASQHYVSAKLSYEWGAFMPKGGSKGDLDSGKAVDYEAYEASLASESVISVAEAASNSEAEVAVVEKKTPAGTFASWLRNKGR
ncbi:MAG: autotransporter outer membrane beta-barrel domain-containing protein [Verrucomicrobiota bacterium]